MFNKKFRALRDTQRRYTYMFLLSSSIPSAQIWAERTVPNGAFIISEATAWRWKPFFEINFQRNKNYLTRCINVGNRNAPEQNESNLAAVIVLPFGESDLCRHKHVVRCKLVTRKRFLIGGLPQNGTTMTNRETSRE